MSSLFLTTGAVSGITGGAEPTRWLLSGVAGASSRLCNKNTTASPASPLQITDSSTIGTDGNTVAWYSVPLGAVTIAGAITCSLWGAESASNANVAPTIGIYRCDSTGVVLATIVAPNQNLGGLEFATTAGTKTISVTAATVVDTAIGAGERLKVALFIDSAVNQGGSGSMGSGANARFYVNGATGGAGQAQIAFTEQIQSAGPGLVFPASAGRVVTAARDAPVIISGS